jgi:hypothetical protein
MAVQAAAVKAAGSMSRRKMLVITAAAAAAAELKQVGKAMAVLVFKAFASFVIHADRLEVNSVSLGRN